MTLTYRELKAELDKLTDEQLNMNVTVYVTGVDEYYPLVGDYPFPTSTDECQVLDAGHPYLVI